MPKHAKIVPITAGRRTLHELHNEMMVPIRNGTCVQLSFSELLMRIGGSIRYPRFRSCRIIFRVRSCFDRSLRPEPRSS